MTFRVALKRCFVWLLCISLCLGLAVPALAEDATGSEIRLLQTEGTVTVTSTSGKSYSTREDMRLYNGYVVSTEEASYAWITLDNEKAVKLDQCSSLEVRRSGKNLELLLKSGELFFNVTAPLKEDEKLNIRTSTMVTGVRGTAGWVKLVNAGESQVGILEGQVICRVTNPVTGASRTLIVKAGQVGVFTVYEADSAGEGAEAHLLGIGSAEEIGGFILAEILQDPVLLAKIMERTDLDFSGLTEAQVEEKLAREQQTVIERLKDIISRMLEEVISKDPLWEGEQAGEGGSATYTITWNYMGVQAFTTCGEGEIPSFAAPDMPGNVFMGWYPDPVPAKADAVYTAIYQPFAGGVEPEQPEEPARYTVTWIVGDNRTEEVYAEGSLPQFTPPEVEGMEFKGWEPELKAVTEDAEYTAVYEEIAKTEYSVVWQDHEGNPLLQDRVESGMLPVYTGEQPAREGYRFVGWTPEVKAADADAVYTAVFEPLDTEAETGTVTWIVNGEEEDAVYTLGETPNHATPTREPSADLTFVFVGWNDGSTVWPEGELPAVTGDVVYTAEFTSQPRVYTVTWSVDGEDTEERYEYGTTLPSRIPEKADTEAAYYLFLGWSDGTNDYAPEELPAVTKDVTYTARFEENPQVYAVTWQNEDGSQIDITYVEYGELPVHGDAAKEATAEFTYTFAGWSPEITEVTGEAAYTATFTESAREYEVTFYGADGTTVLQQGTAVYNETPEYTEQEPTKEGDAQFSYRFIGWEPELAPITADTSYTPQFEEILNTYEITWQNEDGSLLDTTYVEYGGTPVYDGEPTKDSTAEFTYTFAGWDPPIAEVTGEATYTATFTETTQEYTITWVVSPDGNTTEETTVPYGELPTHEDPAEEIRDGTRYTFDGWNTPIVEVTGEATYTATFIETTVYAVELNPPEKGTLECAVTAAAADETVTVTVTPNAGYTVREVRVQTSADDIIANGSGDTYTFTMPAEPVEVVAELSPLEYSVTYQTVPEDADVWLEVDEVAYTDETVTFTVNWDVQSYRLDSVTVNWSDGTNSGTDTPTQFGDDDTVDWTTTRTYTFTMPAGDAVIIANFSRLYGIDTESLVGKVSYSVNDEAVDGQVGYLPEGETVTLELTPENDYVMAPGTRPYVTYYDEAVGDYVAVEVTAAGANTFTFAVPESDVIVSLYSVTVGGSDIVDHTTLLTVSAGGVEADVRSGQSLLVNPGETVTLRITPNTGDGGWLVNTTDGSSPIVITPDAPYEEADGSDEYDRTYSFTMIEEDLSVAVTIIQG